MFMLFNSASSIKTGQEFWEIAKDFHQSLMGLASLRDISIKIWLGPDYFACVEAAVEVLDIARRIAESRARSHALNRPLYEAALLLRSRLYSLQDKAASKAFRYNRKVEAILGAMEAMLAARGLAWPIEFPDRFSLPHLSPTSRKAEQPLRI